MACAYLPPLKTQNVYTIGDDVEIEAGLVDELIMNADDISSEGRGIKLYPNPTTGIVNIEFLNPLMGEVEINTVNVFGKASAFNFDQHQQTVSIDLSPYPKGIYLLTIKTNEGVFTEKVVLQ